jgi:predicted nucleic acid-binding protein
LILVDTSIFVAVANARDNNHDVAMDLLETSSGDLLVLPTVVAETCYMLGRFSSAAGAAFLRDFDDGPLDLTDLSVPDLDRMAELVEQYADFLLGGTDASLVAVAERLGIERIATFDRRHFSAVGPVHIDAFDVLPH